MIKNIKNYLEINKMLKIDFYKINKGTETSSKESSVSG